MMRYILKCDHGRVEGKETEMEIETVNSADCNVGSNERKEREIGRKEEKES